MRPLGSVAIGLAVCAVQAGSPPGYLPVVGPAPLRFQAALTNAVAQLPPLTTTETQTTDDLTATNNTGSASAQSQNSAPNVPPEGSRPPTESAPGPIDTNAVPIISAQMLVPYITGRYATNYDMAVPPPLHFNPAPPPSSTATYTSGPK